MKQNNKRENPADRRCFISVNTQTRSTDVKSYFAYEESVLIDIFKRTVDRYFKAELFFVIFGNWNAPSLFLF